MQTLAHFKKAYPQATFTEINAAIGGTGSDLGVFRVQQDVLSKGPDLLFVEFAVNDGGADPQRIIRCDGRHRATDLEGEPQHRYLFRLHPHRSAFAADARGQAAALRERDGEGRRPFYGIPSITLGMEVAKLAKAGQLLWRAKLPKTDAEKAALAGQVRLRGGRRASA